MLIKAPTIKVFARPFYQKEDNIILQCFVVAKYEDGQIQVLKTFYKTVERNEYENSIKTPEATVLSLPGNPTRLVHEIIRSTFTEEKVSPYTDFSFFVSQPTRAPAL